MKLNNLTIRQLHEHYRQGDFTPQELCHYLLQQARKQSDYNTWIYLFNENELQPYLDNLKNKSIEDLPLYGIPFSIKDNIDLTGIPTTAACKEFTYTPSRTAFVVQQLLDAGAIPLGKTNLDQFATGLVGTRSPYGETHNAFNRDYISGGSSSGSAVSVAQGLVSFSLGTDTAGSGRVPAAFNNIFGLKPSRGLVSNSGVIPACRTLDCVAIFATTAEDLQRLFNITAKFDPLDAYARTNPVSNTASQTTLIPASFSFAIPKASQLEFFGNEAYRKGFEDAISQLQALGGQAHEIDFEPFMQAARLLYEGPWVTERYLATQPIIDEQPEALLDVTRSIIIQGKDKLASDLFSAQYKLQACKQITDSLLQDYDFMLTPTAGTHYTLEEVRQNPVQLNSNLGYYTNYMNLLDYASIAVPTGLTDTGMPFGVTLVSFAFTDMHLLAYAQSLHHSQSHTLGATDWALPEVEQQPVVDETVTQIVVCGAHMQGLPLNHQLTDRGAVLLEQCQSSADYKLIALPGGPPHRPGMLRVNENGKAIDVEVWRLPVDQLGSFLQGIPQPLGLGKVELYDGRWEIGFICEGNIASESEDISEHGGWRAYLSNNN
jgi:allophanate hydrolase